MHPRFSIASLLVTIGGCGVAFAALRHPSEWWNSVLFSSVLLTYALAVAYAAQRTGPSRAFGMAFAAFGVGYLVLVYVPWCDANVSPRLLTSRLLVWAFSLVGSARIKGIDAVTRKAVEVPVTLENVDSYSGKDLYQFLNIGHSLASLFLAVVGGFVARHSFVTRRKETR